MWLITTHGFVSVVQNLNSTGPDDALLVRGRVRADLERFADFAARRGDGGRDLSQGRSRRDLHNLFPVRRGRRLSSAARALRSRSATISLAISSRSCVAAKYRGFT